MIRRLSLSQRLALVVVSLLMLCAVAVCAVQLHSSAQYRMNDRAKYLKPPL